MNIRTLRRAFALAILAAACLPAAAAETVSRAEDREEVAVTIYNDSLALIKEVRRIPFERGANSIALRDVSAKMRPETASLRALSGGSLRLIEQNFDFDLLTPQKLLEKYVGRSVTVIKTNPATGTETREPAEVLARLRAPRQHPEQPLYISAALRQSGRIMVKDEDLCVHCGLCAERCPTNAWDMQKSWVHIPQAGDEARCQSEPQRRRA